MEDEVVVPDPQHDSAGGGCAGKMITIFALVLLAIVITIYAITHYQTQKALDSAHASLDGHQTDLIAAIKANADLEEKIHEVFDNAHENLNLRGPSGEQMFMQFLQTPHFNLTPIEIYIQLLEKEELLRSSSSIPAGQQKQVLRTMRRARRTIVETEDLSGFIWQAKGLMDTIGHVLTAGGGTTPTISPTAIGHSMTTLNSLMTAQGISDVETEDDILRDLDILLSRLAGK